MKRRAYFTLAELCVIIVIMAVLLSLPVTLLSNVQENAQSVTCQNNLKKLGIGCAMYGKDNNDYRPPVRQSQTNAIGAYTSPTGLGLLYTGKYVTDAETFYCPNMPALTAEDNFYAPGNLKKSFAGYASALWKFDWSVKPVTFKMSGPYPAFTSRNPASTDAPSRAAVMPLAGDILFANEGTGGVVVQGNHDNFFNILWADGSVRPFVDEKNEIIGKTSNWKLAVTGFDIIWRKFDNK